MKNQCAKRDVYQEHGKGEKVHTNKELRKFAGVSAETIREYFAPAFEN